VTIPLAPIRTQPSLLPWGLTACAVVASPSLVAAASPVLMLASVAIGLTALVIGFALWQRRAPVSVAVPARRTMRPLDWSS
jgi:hypothetical protein